MTAPFSISRTAAKALRLSLTAALLSSCLATATLAQTAVEPVSGGSMNIIVGSDIKNWDPGITSGTFPGGPMDILDAVYGYLVYVDVNGQLVGGLAESFTSEDATTWTLKLRPGLTFSDGTPYDAEAVKYNWDRLAHPDTVTPVKAFVSGWASGMEVVDATTLVVTLPGPNSNFAKQIAELVPFIASPASLAAAATPTDIQPIGAGPFLLKSWDQGISMTLTRNPNYWDAPRPYLDEITFTSLADINARIATVVQGGATMMAGYPYQFGTNADAEGVATVEVPIRGINRAYFTQTNGLFTDVRAREAFYAGIDRARLMQILTQTDAQLAPVSYFGTGSAYFDEQYQLPGYDPARAQELVNELAAEGKPFNMRLIYSPNADTQRMTAFIQQSLMSLEGVNVDLVEGGEMAVVREQCKAQVDAFCLEPGVIVSNGVEPNISIMLSSTGSMNFGGYTNPTMDAALTAATVTVDEEAIKAAYSDVQELIVNDLPIYIFGEQVRHLLVRDNTGGVVPSNGGILQKQYLFVCAEACVE
ncbi:MAG: ABC transporter substrate-binding protein [Devosia sp.]